MTDRGRFSGRLHGTAVIEESQTTTIVPAGWIAEVNETGDLVLTRDGSSTKLNTDAGVAYGIRHQVLWDRLISVVEEQALAIMRTAFSTSVREAGDLSAGVFDPNGRMLAQAVTGTPGHVNAMAASVGHFLEKYPADSMQSGDVYVTNDPWLGTGHLFDFTVVTPVFLDDIMVGLFASTVHVVDIGGIGSVDSARCAKKALRSHHAAVLAGPGQRAAVRGRRANIARAGQVVGDLYSLASSNDVGARRLYALMRESGLGDLDALGHHIISTSRSAMEAAIGRLPSVCTKTT